MNPVPIKFITDIFTAEAMENPDNYPLKDGAYYRKDLPAGGVEFGRNDKGEIVSLKYICPSGCGAVGHISFEREGNRGWKWDGNETEPTTTPSIQMLTQCRWHGYLTRGQFVSV